MKVILLEDVKALGKKDEIVEVKEGYARNYLFPQKLGVPADNKNLNDVKLKKEAKAQQEAKRLAEAEEMKKKLDEVTVVCRIRAGKDGKAFGSVSTKEIAEEMKKQHELDIDKKKIMLDEPIKALGAYQVQVKLHPQVTAEFTVDVQGE
ncbi:MAG: 50S ribosomal protein L9 [Lachnospiraceae bacterium]|nr:50S ribosomal protein L9 [Lachnospiraceae bacterium]